jgi:hypothetical protein
MRNLAATPERPRVPRYLWAAACAGQVPAEMLPTKDREDLVWNLHELGWTDAEIAAHTFMSTYTTARIRTRLGLLGNEAQRGVA